MPGVTAFHFTSKESTQKDAWLILTSSLLKVAIEDLNQEDLPSEQEAF